MVKVDTLKNPTLCKKCSTESVEWIYNSPYSDNPGEDKSGGIIWEKNHANPAREAWILVGYLNTIMKGSNYDANGNEIPKIVRSINVPKDKPVFCMVASSHASRYEMKLSQRDLRDTAQDIHNRWEDVSLKVDGQDLTKELDDVWTDPTHVNLAQKDAYGSDHPYVKYYTDLGMQPGDLDVISVCRCALLQLDKNEERHVIDFYGRSPGDKATGDIAYEVSTRFNVTLV